MAPKTLAAMTFESLVKNERETANAIIESLPRYDYRSVDEEYRSTLDNYFQIASLWSLEYWRCYAKMLASIGLSVSSRRENDIEQEKEHDDREYLWEGRLRALGMILDELQEKYGIDRSILPYFAGAHAIYGTDEPVDSLSADAKIFYDNYLMMFDSLITGDDLDEEVDNYFKAEPFDKSTSH